MGCSFNVSSKFGEVNILDWLYPTFMLFVNGGNITKYHAMVREWLFTVCNIFIGVLGSPIPALTLQWSNIIFPLEIQSNTNFMLLIILYDGLFKLMTFSHRCCLTPE